MSAVLSSSSFSSSSVVHLVDAGVRPVMDTILGAVVFYPYADCSCGWEITDRGYVQDNETAMFWANEFGSAHLNQHA
jgi:hypothetical protein